MTEDVQPLLKIGPFGGLNSRTTEVYVQSNEAAVLANVDTHRNDGALCNFYGRKAFINFGILGPNSVVTAIARYDVSPTQTFYIGQSSTGVTAYYDPVAGVFSSLSTVTAIFTRAVQSNGVLFLDNGQQIFYGTDGKLHSALWQYPTPNPSLQSYSVSAIVGTPPLAQATYSYAFVQKIELPASSGTINQTTSPVYANTAGSAFSVSVDGLTQDVLLSGVFAGTTTDGYPYVTQVYRESSTEIVADAGTSSTSAATNNWNLLTTLTTNNSFTDNIPDTSITGNQQLTLDAEQPPTGLLDPTTESYTTNPIESFQDRMWVLARVSDANTNNLPQTQLWYTRQGLPWSFDASLQVLLVGDESTTMQGGGNVPIPFGDQTAGIAKVGSYLMVFKATSTQLITGTDQTNYTALPLFADIGLIAPYSVTKGNGLVFWLSAQGCFSWDTSNLLYLSDKIYNALQAIPPVSLAKAVGFYADLTWFLSFPDQNETFAYYIPEKTWTQVPYATNAAAFCTSIGSDVTPQTSFKLNQIAAVRAGTSFVDFWLDGQENDLGAGTLVSWITPISDSGAPQQQKNYKVISCSGPFQPKTIVTVTLSVEPNFADAPPIFMCTFDMSQGPTTKFARVPQVSSRGYTAQLAISATTAVGATIPLQIWSVALGGSIDRSWTVPS